MLKYISFVLLSFCSFSVFAQSESEEKEAINQTIQLYFEGMMERDKAKLDRAFLPEARLIGYRGEEMTITDFETWASGTAKGEKRVPDTFKNELIRIHLKGYTAVAETELFWPGIYYYDYLTLIKVDRQWKIVHKTWYEEKR